MIWTHCPRCGALNRTTRRTCSACADPLPAPIPSAPIPKPGSKGPAPAGPAGGGPSISISLTPVWTALSSLFHRPVRIRGHVLDAKDFKATPTLQLSSVIGAVLAFVIIGWIALRLVATIIPLLFCLSIFGLAARTMLRMTFRGFPHFTPSLFGRCWGGRPYHGRREIQVHLVELQELHTGRKVLVRVEGEYVLGTISKGHDIEVEGPERNGTILFRAGYNHSFAAEIRVNPWPVGRMP